MKNTKKTYAKRYTREDREKLSTVPGAAMGVRVMDDSDKEFAIALRKFKTITKEAGILDEFKTRKEFEKPSATKRKAKQYAILRNGYDLKREL